MLVDTSQIVTAAIGSERRVIEATDNTVVVPSLLQAVFEPILQTQSSNNGAELQRFSSISGGDFTRTNQAALDSTILTLSRGLWELEFTGANAFNWAHVIGSGVGEVEVYIVIDNGVQNLFTCFARIGSMEYGRRVRIMTLGTWELHHLIGLTGLGQTTDAAFQVTATKFL
jgi:hypothetical protein